MFPILDHLQISIKHACWKPDLVKRWGGRRRVDPLVGLREISCWLSVHSGEQDQLSTSFFLCPSTQSAAAVLLYQFNHPFSFLCPSQQSTNVHWASTLVSKTSLPPPPSSLFALLFTISHQCTLTCPSLDILSPSFAPFNNQSMYMSQLSAILLSFNECRSQSRTRASIHEFQDPVVKEGTNY